MGGRKRKRKERSLIELPWQFSAGLAIASYIGVRWALPAFLPATGPLSAIAPTLAQIAWLPLCAFGATAILAKLRSRIQGRIGSPSSNR